MVSGGREELNSGEDGERVDDEGGLRDENMSEKKGESCQ